MAWNNDFNVQIVKKVRYRVDNANVSVTVCQPRKRVKMRMENLSTRKFS